MVPNGTRRRREPHVQYQFGWFREFYKDVSLHRQFVHGLAPISPFPLQRQRAAGASRLLRSGRASRTRLAEGEGGALHAKPRLVSGLCCRWKEMPWGLVASPLAVDKILHQPLRLAGLERLSEHRDREVD